jgi:hypothetical protein
MPSLVETQARIRDAVVSGETHAAAPLLVGGRDATRRLAIHHRHFETSLVTALLGRFPATAWLVGTPFLTDGAGLFARKHPPRAPCIAEYGADFPTFLSAEAGVGRLPYLRQFMELEWSVGLVSVAVDRPSVALAALSRIDAGELPELTLVLQPGLRYHTLAWPVDELIRVYLTDTAPEHFTLEPADLWIEIRGARGTVHMNRLERGDFVFRRALHEGLSIADAAERALDEASDFEPGRALTDLVAAGLVTAANHAAGGGAA